VRLAREDTGGALTCVVLLHGHPFNRSMWAPQTPALRGRHRVLAPDLRGYGESPVTPGTVTMAELASDVLAMLDELGIDSFAPVGLSMGGLVAMELAIAAPTRCRAIGLVATTAAATTPAEQEDRLARASGLERDGMRPLADEMIEQLLPGGSAHPLAPAVIEMMLATDPRGAAAALRGRAQRPDYRPLLAALGLESLVCVGDADPYSTAAVTDELVGCLRRPRRVTLEGVGHLPNLERPERFNDELLRFLDGTRSGSPAR
jgi:3-oxoadipate enol-lactonase